MDLIDRDELELDTEWSEYYDGFTSYSQSQINGAVEVQAIPISENATNGDVIKAMFNPCHIIKYTSDVQVYFSEKYYKFFEMSWWNSPYKGERGGRMSRLIDADRLLKRTKFYNLPNGNKAIDEIDILHAPTVQAIPIPDNATNGDMIKAMFPNELLTSITSTLWWGDNMSFNKDWWNAPYKRGTE